MVFPRFSPRRPFAGRPRVRRVFGCALSQMGPRPFLELRINAAESPPETAPKARREARQPALPRGGRIALTAREALQRLKRKGPRQFEDDRRRLLGSHPEGHFAWMNSTSPLRANMEGGG